MNIGEHVMRIWRLSLNKVLPSSLDKSIESGYREIQDFKKWLVKVVWNKAVCALMLAAAALTAGAATSPPGALTPANQAQQAQARNALNKLPMHFEAHAGAAGGNNFRARGRGYHLSINEDGLVLNLKRPTAVPTDPEARRAWARERKLGNRQADAAKGPAAVVRKAFPGANRNATAIGEDLLPAKSHYMIGKDQRQWRRNGRQ